MTNERAVALAISAGAIAVFLVVVLVLSFPLPDPMDAVNAKLMAATHRVPLTEPPK